MWRQVGGRPVQFHDARIRMVRNRFQDVRDLVHQHMRKNRICELPAPTAVRNSIHEHMDINPGFLVLRRVGQCVVWTLIAFRVF